MKAKSRKRLLISSIAMLLVAMIALGTATFAWFTQSTSASASGINVRTVKASELKLQSMDENWKDSLNYSYNKTLKPASSANGTDWYKADADAKGSYAAKTSTITSAGTYSKAKQGIEDYVFMNQLNVANFGGATVQDVTITFTLAETDITDGAKYARFAVVEAAASGYGTDSLPAFKNGGFATNSYVYAAGSTTRGGGIVGGGQTKETPASTYKNVAVWNNDYELQSNIIDV